MLQFAADQLDHYGVVEEAEAGDAVRDQVFRFGEIGEGVEDAVGLSLRQSPLDVPEHFDQQSQFLQPLGDECGNPVRPDGGQQLLGGGDDFLRRNAGRGGAGLLHDQPEMPEIVIVEFESNPQPHSIAPRTLTQRSLTRHSPAAILEGVSCGSAYPSAGSGRIRPSCRDRYPWAHRG